MSIQNESGLSIAPPSGDSDRVLEATKRKGIENFSALLQWHRLAENVGAHSPFVVFDEPIVRNAITQAEDVIKGVVDHRRSLDSGDKTERSVLPGRTEWLQRALRDQAREERVKQQAFAERFVEKGRRVTRLFGDATEVLVMRSPITHRDPLEKTYIGLANNGIMVGFRYAGGDFMKQAILAHEHPELDTKIAPWTKLQAAFLEAMKVTDPLFNQPPSENYPSETPPVTVAEVQQLINEAIKSVRRQVQPTGIRVPIPAKT